MQLPEVNQWENSGWIQESGRLKKRLFLPPGCEIIESHTQIPTGQVRASNEWRAFSSWKLPYFPSPSPCTAVSPSRGEANTHCSHRWRSSPVFVRSRQRDKPQGIYLESTGLETQAGFLYHSYEQNSSFFGKLQFLLLRPWNDWMKPTGFMEDNVLYLKSTDNTFNQVTKYLHSNT